MKKIILLFVLGLILNACMNDNVQDLTKEQKEKAQAEIIDLMKQYNTAFQNKDFPGLVHTLHNDVVFFGSDSTEAIKSLTEFKEVVLKQWKFYDKMSYGEINNPTIYLDPLGTFASIIYGLPCYYREVGKSDDGYFFLRVARTLKKEKSGWKIISGIVSVTSTGKIHQDTSSPDIK